MPVPPSSQSGIKHECVTKVQCEAHSNQAQLHQTYAYYQQGFLPQLQEAGSKFSQVKVAAYLAVGHALENNVLSQGYRAEVGHEQQRSEPCAQRVQACTRQRTQSHAVHMACGVLVFL